MQEQKGEMRAVKGQVKERRHLYSRGELRELSKVKGESKLRKERSKKGNQLLNSVIHMF